MLEKAPVLILTLSSRGPAQLKVRAWRVRGQAFLPFLGTVSAASHPYLMASSTQVCRGTGGEPIWLLLQNWNAWSVLQQPWGCGLLGNPPAAKRQCKERQESELEKAASSHPWCSRVIFYPCCSKADHAPEHLPHQHGATRTCLTFPPDSYPAVAHWVHRKQKAEMPFRSASFSQVHELTCQSTGKEEAPRVPQFQKTRAHYSRWRLHFGAQT